MKVDVRAEKMAASRVVMKAVMMAGMRVAL